MATSFSGSGYQATLASLSSDPTIIDGSGASGPDSSGSVNGTISLTAIVDLGSSISVTTFAYNIGYEGFPSISGQYSTNGTAWSNLISSGADHAGTFSLVSSSITGLPVTARYLRLSLTDDASGNGIACRATIREVTINGIVVALRRRTSTSWLNAGRTDTQPDGVFIPPLF